LAPDEVRAGICGSVVAAGDGTFARGDFLAMIVLADAYLAAGVPEQACGTALIALMAGEQIRSGRCVNYLREFRDHLARIGDAPPCWNLTSKLSGPGCGGLPCGLTGQP
jgi:hypothetical protein